MRLGSFSRILKDFIATTSGGVAIILGLSAPVIIGMVAIATDYATMSSMDTRLQMAADSAALASAKEMTLSGATNSQIEEVARSYVMRNLGVQETSGSAETASQKMAQDSASDEKTVDDNLSVNVSISKTKGTVEVDVVQKWNPLFMHFISADVKSVAAKAKAQTRGARLTCVIGLAPMLPAGIQLWNDASLTADGCDVYSNTASPSGIVLSDNSSLIANQICVVGGYVAHGPRTVQPEPTTDCPPIEDPLANRKAPDVGACDFLLPQVILNQTKTLKPGVYCGGISILGTSNVTLSPGIYVIKNGTFTVAGKATLTGEHVGIYLTGLISLLQFDSDTTIELSAPVDGPLAGILLFEDRTAPPLRVHRIGSNNARKLVGTIYLPVGVLMVDANAPVATESAYTALVVRSLQLQKGPNLILHSDYESTDVPVPEGLIGNKVVLAQ